MSDSGRGGAAVSGATKDLNAPPYDPTSDPTNAAYYLNTIPPWITAGYPDFGSWSAAIGGQKAADEAYRQGQIALQQKQINATSGASGASTVNANIAAGTAAAQLAQNQQQYQSTQDMQKAINDQQYALSQGGLMGSLGGQNTLARDQMNQNQNQFNSKQALDYYTQLSNLASNPRNFVQSFFQQRGELPPAAANGQGNVDAIQRYLPFLLGQGSASAGGGTTARASMPSAPTASMPTAPATNAPQAGGAYNAATQGAGRVAQALGPGVSWGSGNTTGFSANGMPQGTPATQLGGGTPRIAGQTEDPNLQAFRQNVAQNALGGNVTQEQAMNPKDRVGGLAIYAKGGIVPEPVIGRGVHSGKTYVFGENGPEGVVPADYLPDFLKQRGGQMSGDTHNYAVGGVIGDKSPYPYSPPTPTDTVTQQVNSPAQGVPQDTYNVGVSPGAVANYGLFPGVTPPTGSAVTVPGGYPYSGTAPSAPTSSFSGTPNMTGSSTAPSASGGLTTTVSGISAYGNPYSAPQSTAPVPLTPQNNFNPFPQTPTLSNPAPPLGAPAAAAPSAPAAPAPTGAVTPIVNTAPPAPPVVQAPQELPQASNNFNNPTGGQPPAQNPASFLPGSLFPRDVSAPGTFGNAISGRMPSFLSGEDQPDPNSVLGQMASMNAIPPFLVRALAQQRGLQQYGTNVPQAMNLPKDLPLMSKMAYSQMTPSEQQALLSYASSYGITPDDYMNLMEQYGPQGGNHPLPTFGSPIQYNRQ